MGVITSCFSTAVSLLYFLLSDYVYEFLLYSAQVELSRLLHGAGHRF